MAVTAKQDTAGKVRPVVAVFLGYLGLTILFTWPTIARMSASSSLGFDSFLFRWNFWWFKYALCDLGTSPFHTDHLFWPNGTTLALHSYCLPYALASIPFQWIWGSFRGTAIALNAAFFFSTLATALLGFALARNLGISRKASFFSGAAIAFSPSRMITSHTPHVFATEFLLAAILLFVQATRDARFRRGLWLGGALALLYMTSLEHALFFAIFAAIWVPWYARNWSKRKRSSLSRTACAAAATFLIIAGPYLWSQGAALLSGEVAIRGSHRAEEAESKSPSLVDFFLPNRLSTFYRKSLGTLTRWGTGESMHFGVSFGYTVLLLGCLGVAAKGRRKLLPWLVIGLVFFVLSLGPRLKVAGPEATGPSLPFLLMARYVPFFGMARYPDRFSVLTRVVIALAAGLGLDRVLSRRSSWSRAVGPPYAILAAFLSLYVFEALSVPLLLRKHPVSPFYRQLKDLERKGGVLDLTLFSKSPMLYAIQHKRPIVMKSTEAVPRCSKGSMALLRENPDLARLVELTRLPSLRRDEIPSFVRNCARGLRRANIAFVVVHHTDYGVHPAHLREYVMPEGFRNSLDDLLGRMGLRAIHRGRLATF